MEKLSPFMREAAINALRSGGISLVTDIARSLTIAEIEQLSKGLEVVRKEKLAEIEVKNVG